MRLVLLGAPGSGKGTQAAALAEHFGVPHISSGELLRAEVDARTKLGRQAADHLDRGELVPDDLVVAVVHDALAAGEAAAGYVLEGFPRTVAQARRAESLGPAATPSAVVFLELPDEVARERIAQRARAGRTDDVDPDVIDHRLRVFHADTEPLVDFYARRGLLVTVDATPPPDVVERSILASLDGRDLAT